MNELMVQNVNSIQAHKAHITPDLYIRFIGYLDASPKTIQTYTRALKQFFVYLNEHCIDEPTREDILAYRDYLKESKKPNTVQGYIVAVRLFFQWTAQEGMYPNVADKVKGAKISKEHKKDYLTGAQMKRVLKNIDRSTLTGKRDYAILSLMVTGSLRDIEVNRANMEDIGTIGENTVLYIQGKGREEKTDYVKLSAAVENAVRDYLQACPDRETKGPLFTSTSNNSKGQRMTTRSISGIVKARLKAAGFNSDRLTAHSLRHTGATLNLLNGGSLEDTQQLLRHSNINTTMIYAHHIDRAKNQSEERISGALFG